MSLHLEFEPHSWYKGFAIKFDPEPNDPCEWVYHTDSKYCRVHDFSVHPSDTWCEGYYPKWQAYTDDGMTYSIVERHASTLKELKQLITEYRSK